MLERRCARKPRGGGNRGWGQGGLPVSISPILYSFEKVTPLVFGISQDCGNGTFVLTEARVDMWDPDPPSSPPASHPAIPWQQQLPWQQQEGLGRMGLLTESPSCCHTNLPWSSERPPPAQMGHPGRPEGWRSMRCCRDSAGSPGPSWREGVRGLESLPPVSASQGY